MKNTTTQEITASTTLYASVNCLHTAKSLLLEESAQLRGIPGMSQLLLRSPMGTQAGGRGAGNGKSNGWTAREIAQEGTELVWEKGNSSLGHGWGRMLGRKGSGFAQPGRMEPIGSTFALLQPCSWGQGCPGCSALPAKRGKQEHQSRAEQRTRLLTLVRFEQLLNSTLCVRGVKISASVGKRRHV